MATFGESKSILLLIFPSKRRAIIIVKDERERKRQKVISMNIKLVCDVSIYI